MRKIFIWGLMVLFILSLAPMPSQAGNLESTSTALKPGSLVKGSWSSVYYFGADNKRYVFPNEKTYSTWFVNFNLIIHISDDLLGSVPIGGNVTYKPGKRLVKITTDPKVYWVDKEGTLRHLKNEEIAKALFGYSWHILVDDVPDAYFVNYKIGAPIEKAVLPDIAPDYSINNDKLLSDAPDPSENQLGSIILNGAATDATTIKLSWTPKNFVSEKGYKVVMSNQPNPVYPGNNYHYLSDPNASVDKWYDLFQAGTYYFRVCEYLGGGCGIYSNEIAIKIGGTTPTVSDEKINLTATADGNNVNLNWSLNFTSPKGFKIVKSTESNPVYPGNDYHYLSAPETRSDKWKSLSSGKTYHFRVCEYLGGACGTYSNDVAVTIEGPVIDNSNGTITLSGYYDQSLGKVRLEWALGSLYSEKGFKVVNSTQPYPVYPGNDYHYLSSPETRSDKWVGLEPGAYHFRVCEYLGGACGIYSNDLTINVQ